MPLDGHTKNVDIMQFEELDFTINPEDRSIIHVVWDKAEQEFVEAEKHTLMQYETNSTKMVFDIPRYINGHDMRECNIVQIHYRNSGATTNEKRRDIYNVTDLEVYPNTTDYDGEEVLRFSWDISNNATQYAGNIEFVVHFICTDAGANADPKDPSTYGVILYNWSTAICEVLQVMKGMNNNDLLTDETPDYIVGFNKLVVPSFDWVEDLSLDPTDPGYGEKNILQITNKTDGTVVESLSLKGEQGDNIELRASDGYIQWKLRDAEDTPENWTNLIAISSLRGEKGDTGEKGVDGVNGIDGKTPQIAIGKVESVSLYDQEAKITIDNTDPSKPKLDFVLPRPANDHIETINGADVWVFKGTKDEYAEFVEINPDFSKHENVLSIITDDELDNDLKNLEALSGKVTSLETEAEELNIKYDQLKVRDEIYQDKLQPSNLHLYGDKGGEQSNWPLEFETIPIPETWDRLALYEYYDADGNPLIVNNKDKTNYEFVETVKCSADDDKAWPSEFGEGWYTSRERETAESGSTVLAFQKHDKNADTWTPESPEDSDFYMTNGQVSESNYPHGSHLVYQYDNVAPLVITINGITKEVPVGKTGVFENIKNDSFYPDIYDGDGIRYLVKAVVTPEEKLSIYIGTQIYCKGFPKRNSLDNNTKEIYEEYKKYFNKHIEYNYDPQNKHGNVGKTIVHQYAFGTNKTKVNIVVSTYSALMRKSIELPDRNEIQKIVIDAEDFLFMRLRDGVPVRSGDYILDADNILFQILDRPDGITGNQLTVMPVSTISHYMVKMKEMVRSIFGISKLVHVSSFSADELRNKLEFEHIAYMREAGLSDDIEKVCVGNLTIDQYKLVSVARPASYDTDYWLINKLEILDGGEAGIDSSLATSNRYWRFKIHFIFNSNKYELNEDNLHLGLEELDAKKFYPQIAPKWLFE